MTTARELSAQGHTPQTPSERLRATALELTRQLQKEGFGRSDAFQALFPRTVLDDAVLEVVVSALLSGNHLLMLGPPGSGKTSLAKDIWQLFPKEVWAVDGCPVQDDPFSLFDEKFAARVPACPYCKTAYGGVSLKEIGDFDPTAVDPAKVKVRRIRLREGYGLARVQGSPEVFPDNLTGSINLAKLEEVGDPTSPLILEPGKLLQANRGVLLVDEVGKLPRGTQNVLLQGLQESIVTPAKSRETFPASFVAITTSNLDDLDNISEPLNDRLVNIHVPFNADHRKNRRIVDMGFRPASGVFAPESVREAAVLLVERWRKTSVGLPELYEVGSNRSMLDVLRRAEAFALLAGDGLVGPAHFARGAREAMAGRIRARGGESLEEGRTLVAQFVEKQAPAVVAEAAEAYWCRFFVDELKEDKAEGERTIREVREVLAMPAERRAEAARKAGGHPRFARFADYVALREGTPRGERAELVGLVWSILEETKAFSD
ncbi:MAG: ATP-binding protein [Methanobacteriota archaeon]